MRLKNLARNANDIADIKAFIFRIRLVAHHIAPGVNLYLAPAVHNMEKACFSHNALRDNPSGNAYRAALKRIKITNNINRGMCLIKGCNFVRIPSFFLERGKLIPAHAQNLRQLLRIFLLFHSMLLLICEYPVSSA